MCACRLLWNHFFLVRCQEYSKCGWWFLIVAYFGVNITCILKIIFLVIIFSCLYVQDLCFYLTSFLPQSASATLHYCVDTSPFLVVIQFFKACISNWGRMDGSTWKADGTRDLIFCPMVKCVWRGSICFLHIYLTNMCMNITSSQPW